MAPKGKKLSYYEAVGRRRSAVARVRLYMGAKTKKLKINSAAKKGDIFVNDMPIEDYFPSDVYKKQYMLPLTVTDSEKRFMISIITNGGGKHGQMEAIKLGLARALELADEENRQKLKSLGLLTRDARIRERRKPGKGGKARRKKSSPKR